ncbi:MAG: hypothetical protein JOZ51_01775 [Chloroflexi bacterium]|nr:hypothetical protein [Chloroflexota bacterium]
MSEPVLVIHGVGNRDRNAFEAEVRTLADRVGDAYRLIPVFWGDLGATTEGLLDTIPQIPSTTRSGAAAEIDPALIEAALGTAEAALGAAGAQDAVRSGADQHELIVQGAATQLEQSPAGVRSTDQTEAVREAVRDTLPHTRFLHRIRDANVLDAIGRAVGAATKDAQPTPDATGEPAVTRGGSYTNSSTADTRGVFDGVKHMTQNLLTEIDNLVGTAVGTALGRANQNLRRALGVQIVNFIGDVVVYQREYAKIQQRLWQAIAEHAPGYGTQQQPINVIAHSLGGVVTFDTAVRGQPPLWINGLVTFGSQSALFQVIDPRLPELARYAENAPVALPPRIGRWTNLWEFMDPLAFSTSVFRLSTGQTPQDVYVDNPMHVLMDTHGMTHSTYWRSEELIQAIRETIR